MIVIGLKPSSEDFRFIYIKLESELHLSILKCDYLEIFHF